MRLVDASDDDVLVTQAWGEGLSIPTWTQVGRHLRALIDAWHARKEGAPWAGEAGPRVLTGLVMGAVARAGGSAITVPYGMSGYLGDNTFMFTVVSAWLDLAAYDPDEAIRTLVDTGVMEDRVSTFVSPDTRRGTLVTLVHHADPARGAAGVARFKSLPLAAVERLSPSGVRVDVFPAWATTQRVNAVGRVAPGVTILLAMQS